MLLEKDKKAVYDKWRKLVNMTASELKSFYDSNEGKVAGLTAIQAKTQGIDSGRESARWILKMKKTPVQNWSPAMWKWANKQISFISRMSGMKGKLYDDKGKKTRKHTSLLIWGHNPEKMSNGGKVPKITDAQKEKLRERAIEILDNSDKLLAKHFKANVDKFLEELSEQCHSSPSEKQGAFKMITPEIAEIAMVLYPNARPKGYENHTKATSLAQVNKSLHKKHPLINLNKGQGYFYISSDDKEMGLKLAKLYTTSIYVFKITDQSVERWVHDVDVLLADDDEVILEDGGLVKSFNRGHKKRAEDLKSEYPNSFNDVNRRVASEYLYFLAKKLKKVPQGIEFKNDYKNPTNHFQMEMYMTDGTILYTSPFVYVDDNHKVVDERTKVELLDENYETLQTFAEGGEVTDFGKVISASSRFKPKETIFFDPPLLGINGAKLIAYTWAYEWTMKPNYEGELVGKRISDWTQAEISADTGRDIVHKYDIDFPDGTSKTVSSESVPILLGFTDRKQLKSFPNLSTAAKTLAKQKLKMAVLQQKDEELAKAKEEILKEPLPPIEKVSSEMEESKYRQGFYEVMNVWKIGNSGQIWDRNYNRTYDEAKKLMNVQKPEGERYDTLLDSYKNARLKQMGFTRTYNHSTEIYELKNRIARQERKIQEILKKAQADSAAEFVPQ